MAFKKVKEQDYPIHFIAGDTEFVRLTVKDEDGAVIDVSEDVTVTMGVKRKPLDDEFIIPEVIATTYAYNAVDQVYTIEIKFEDIDTVALLNYNDKERKLLKCYYDIELHNTHLGADERTTILAGDLTVSRSIAGKVK